MKFSVTKNGKELDKKLYTWDEKTRTFSSKESLLVLDFTGINNCTFRTGSYCIFKTGDDCTFDTGFNCVFKTGDDCTFKAGDDCTFQTGDNCTFDTGNNCTFDTGDNCTFDTYFNCVFNTGFNCTFDTGFNCTFDTGSDCTFKAGSYCIFKTGAACTFDTCADCVLIRRDIFEYYDISNKKIHTAPYSTKGYIENGYYYLNGEKQYPAIIADGILSEIIKKRGNVYHVKNYDQDEVTYLVTDGENYSHGETLKQAKDSLIYKISNRDTSKYESYTLDTEITKEEAIKMYRAITGACEQGTRYFCENNKVPKKMTVHKVIELTKGQYNCEKLVEFFKRK